MKMLDQTCGKCREAIILDIAGALPAEQRFPWKATWPTALTAGPAQVNCAR
jgi:hypothetical protein